MKVFPFQRTTVSAMAVAVTPSSSSLSPLAHPASSSSSTTFSCLHYVGMPMAAIMDNLTSAEVQPFEEQCMENANFSTTSGPPDTPHGLQINDYIRIPMYDLLLGVFCMPFTLTGQILRKFIFGAAMCKMIPYLQVVSVAVSTFTLCSISIERYFAICRPLTSRHWQTVSHAIKMTVVCWLLAFLTGSPILFTSRQEKYFTDEDGVNYYSCRERYFAPWMEVMYNCGLFVILFGIPGVFMTWAYVKITRTLLYAGTDPAGPLIATKESSSTPFSPTAAEPPTVTNNGSLAKLSSKLARFRAGSHGHQTTAAARNGSAAGLSSHHAGCEDADLAGDPGGGLDTPNRVMSPGAESVRSPSCGQGGGVRNTNAEKNLQAKKRVVLMLIIVVFEFFICFTPLWLVNISSFFWKEILDRVGGPGITYLQLLMYISTCCNPITYCFLHSKFRQGMIQAFTCKRNKPEISDLLRSRTTKLQMSYHKNDSLSTKSLNNVVIPLSQKKGPCTKSIGAATTGAAVKVKAESIPMTIPEDELSKYAGTSVNQSTEITWL
ncbi:putative Gastrin/cholecystokinin type B receptor [Hypsibius exemplaris]|uniref:Gastrin/cholecystokinin type B receptor n=1 Tax=Hypsibius exemplaris TaxID=2072580 RepID=A0A1W0WHW4_HYPEX|nr:putative Gastrin/cholecystokinin type B receptor [Hypsibius exemplaris]